MAASRSCAPAFGPIHSTRSAVVRHLVGAELGAQAVEELVALGLELDLDPVVALARERSGCSRRRGAGCRSTPASCCLMAARSGVAS